MNSETHKVIVATYCTEVVYAIPKDWKLDDLFVRWGKLYHKGEIVNVPMAEVELDSKFPQDLEESSYDLEGYFDCE